MCTFCFFLTMWSICPEISLQTWTEADESWLCILWLFISYSTLSWTHSCFRNINCFWTFPAMPYMLVLILTLYTSSYDIFSWQHVLCFWAVSSWLDSSMILSPFYWQSLTSSLRSICIFWFCSSTSCLVSDSFARHSRLDSSCSLSSSIY